MIDTRLRNVAFLVAGVLLHGVPRRHDRRHRGAADRARRSASPPSATGLVITAYLVTVAVFIPLSGWLTLRFGTARVFLAAIAIFAVASLGCALSTTPRRARRDAHPAGRGGAMMVPVGRIVVLAGAERPRSCG